MAEHEATPTLPPSRSAKFKRHADHETLPTDMTLGRRAEFRPSEQIAVRRDVVEAYRQGLLRDIAGTTDSDAVRDRAMFASALADEATRNYDRAAMQLARLRRQTDFWADEWAAVRRVHRRLDEPELVAESLDASFACTRGVERALVGLERARHDWLHGVDPKLVARWVRRAMSEFANGGRRALHKMPRLSAAWAVQIATDAAAEAGHFDRAMTLLEAFAEHPELNAQERQLVSATLGLWHAALGNQTSALQVLEAAGEQGVLPPDVEDAWVHMLFAQGEREHAHAVLKRAADRLSVQAPHAVTLAELQYRAQDPQHALQTLDVAAREQDDSVIQDLAMELIEHLQDGEHVINVLNRRLETEEHPARRAALLARLGKVYESEAGSEQAAADVYREALELVPDYAPAIRALGRLYSRSESWGPLAELFEHEIDALHGAPTVWRRQFQVARLYEGRLDNFERALDHYTAVLRARPDYLPALKGAARILSGSRRWKELAELFLDAAATTVSKRQKLYLLDRVAEVAETHLGRFDVAIGAWEEIHHMDPLHPRAFSSLGRLYARTQRWTELLALNEREIAQADDEEASALLVRNAEIAEAELGRTDLAEASYRRVLERLPDYLPALEGLGRIYARGGRWNDLVTMTDAQLRATTDPREARRQLGALAELYESQLGRAEDAISVYERMREIDPRDSWAAYNLERLYRTTKRWDDTTALLADEPEANAGRLGLLAEWRLDRPDTAYHHYLRALEAEPANRHWLEGVARTWPTADVDPAHLADALEALLMSPMAAETTNRYFTILARLREASERTPDAGRAYRAHGDQENLESRIVMRLCRAANGERAALDNTRRTEPVLPWDVDVNVDRMRPTQETMERLNADSVDPAERRFFAAEFDPAHGASLARLGDGTWIELAAELQRVLSGPPQQSLGENELPAEVLRLRAVEAREADDLAEYVAITAAERQAHPSQQGRVYRCLEVASALRDDARNQWLIDACTEAFPERRGEEYMVADGPVYDRLYESLRDNFRWADLADALDTHIRRDLTLVRKTQLCSMLAQVYEDQLGDLDAAAEAYEDCWKIENDPRFLRDLVRVNSERGDIETATRWQRTHFDAMEPGSEATLQSALWLSDLLCEGGFGDDAINELEALVDPPRTAIIYDTMLRSLARLHVDFGDPHRAVDLFQKVLPIHATADVADDWRTLIGLHRDALRDLAAAYALQWKLVRSLPNSPGDLDVLVDTALDLGELPDCCKQLQSLAAEHEGETRITLLGRAAVALDEDLNWAEDAVRLYTEVLNLIGEDPERARDYRRRHAFCLSRIVGREAEALSEFRDLALAEPFEPSTYRGIVELFDRTHAYDRARIGRQILVGLGCEVDTEAERQKTSPSRALDPQDTEELLLPPALRGGVLGCLRAVMPIAEKVWAAELPQRKAFDGARVREGQLLEMTSDALVAFGIRKFKLHLADATPLVPQVLSDGSIWLNEELVESCGEGELRWLAGMSAALMWSDVASLGALDGRRVWHLLEAVLLKSGGRGFGERVDVESQRLAEEVGGAFFTVARRRVLAALEATSINLVDAHCEAWPNEVLQFAARAGLVLGGDVPSALRGLMKLRGVQTDSAAYIAALSRQPAAADLLRFASSDAFLAARHALGLSGRPSEV